MEYIRCQMENRLRRNDGREYALTQGGYYYARLYNLPKAWRPPVEGLLLAIVLHIGTWGHCSSNCITRSRLADTTCISYSFPVLRTYKYQEISPSRSYPYVKEIAR